jgi:hypothetical protein
MLRHFNCRTRATLLILVKHAQVFPFGSEKSPGALRILELRMVISTSQSGCLQNGKSFASGIDMYAQLVQESPRPLD